MGASQAKRVAAGGLLVAAAMLMSFLETLVPLAPGIPGIRLGLANVVILFVLVVFGWREALAVSLARIMLSALLFGSVFSFFYSLCGSLASLLVMTLLLNRTRLGLIPVSGFGGLCHNLGQFLCATVFLRSPVLLYYFPALMAAGILTGLLIGFVVRLLLPGVKRVIAGEEAGCRDVSDDAVFHP